MEKRIEAPEPMIVRYLHEKAARNRIPINVSMELTARCNFSCKMCYVHSADCNRYRDQELSAAQWISIAQQAKEAGVVFFLLTGGEPFLHDDFCEIYRALAHMGFVISINTNLSLLNEEILALFSQFRPNRVNVSLYGASNETYAALCGVPAFDTVTANIEKLRAQGIPVKINSSLTPQNADDLEAIMAYCERNALVFKGTGYMFPAVRLDKTAARLSPAQVAALRAKTDAHILTREAFAERTRRILGGIAYEREQECPELPADGGGIRCRAGSSAAWVDWRGNMSYCGMIPADPENNILNCGFAACWQATVQKAQAVRMPAKCAGCEYKHLCSNCAASQFCETGGFTAPPPYLCEISAHVPAAYQAILNAGEQEGSDETEL